MFEKSKFTSGDVPIYQQIADAVLEGIAEGSLRSGDKLPTQREIARLAGVNLTTVTRAFAALHKSGVVESRPGRGAVVVSPADAASFKSSPVEEDGYIDLSVNRPATTDYLSALAKLLPELERDSRFAALQDFHSPEGPAWARKVIGNWVSTQLGRDVTEQIIITNGAQHGLSCALGAVARPGDVVLADEVTYQGIAALCRTLDVTLKPVGMDEEGMEPENFRKLCREFSPVAVFLVPVLHNPTTITLSADRRQKIAGIAREFGLVILEDDVYRPLKTAAPDAFATTDPDITIYITSFSKCVAPGLRLGMMVPPNELMTPISTLLRINCWSTSPLNALVATRMIEDNLVEQAINGQKREYKVRHDLLKEELGGFDVHSDDEVPHAWVKLPEPWLCNAFVRAASQSGVGVLSGEAFAVNRDNPQHAVRINLAAARSREDLRHALSILKNILSGDNRLFDTVM